MTGGTALSEFYFRHRVSEDLDFFTEKPIDSNKVISLISNLGDNLHLLKIEQQNLSGQNTFFMYFGKTSFVKLDFSEFPFPHLGKFNKFNNLNISSVEDITVNKIHAITTRKRARDYFDLFMCINHLKWEISDLIKNYRLKFDNVLTPTQLATSFVNVADAEDLPVFLGDYDFKEIEKYFLLKAKEMKGSILK
jgi:predicted nucleotidyltransferase component of viral defense system